MKNTVKTFIIAILIPLSTGIIASLLTMNNMQIYSQLQTPPLAPPSFLFPIVWTILYVLMGVSSGIIYINNSVKGLGYYIISLVFNFFWSIVFFNLRWFLFAFIWLLFLLFFIVKTITSYRTTSTVAAYLQFPYALWVAFAGYLNFGIWFLNI